MFWKDAFIYTVREDPNDAETVSHKLMIRSGMIQKLASGIYNYLPLGLKVIRKIEDIIREEMAAVGAQELLMPAVIPAELWKESGRWSLYGGELLRIKDRKDNDFCIGPTHEEVVVDVARRSMKSYKDLPKTLYQIQSKFRDETRPRYGLMRGREFIMKDAYSFHPDENCLDEMYWKMHSAYTRIFERCGLEFRPVEADSGAIGGDITHEFHVLADSGEDTIASCTDCQYAANVERAQAMIHQEDGEIPEDAEAILKVSTPGKKSIEDVSSFLNVKPEQCMKTLIYRIILDDESTFLVSASIRGDLELNETKLKNHFQAVAVEVPEENELKELGLSVGYLGVLDMNNKNIEHNIADITVKNMGAAVCGANEKDSHLTNVWIGRDLVFKEYVDLGFVSEGQYCPKCQTGKLALKKGIEVGQVFKLGKKYTASMNMSVLGSDGKPIYPFMGCYGIGVGRTAAAAIEQNYDDQGIIWPKELAPFEVDLISLDPGKKDADRVVEKLHDELIETGVDVLVDDRKERPGVKFKDCDLIGFPVKVVVGKRGLKEGSVEIKRREDDKSENIKIEKAVSYIRDCLK